MIIVSHRPRRDHAFGEQGAVIEPESIARASIHVNGRVQGVGYRAFTYRLAVEKGLRGGVRNLPDGRVEVVVEGEQKAVNALLDDLARGPSRAKVDTVQVEWQLPTGNPAGFEVWY